MPETAAAPTTLEELGARLSALELERNAAQRERTEVERERDEYKRLYVALMEQLPEARGRRHSAPA